ncbi:hypothetical protein KGF54_002286 [Candida jiufengensis]|uniref:uncharacterized protein n=1 Tax=Candida jiufengensis TaxID=497108 RepID=UPI00222597E5|nr:uncharacterized protein KGF54_002286 [Candida jiufengensis]KAI5954511.1 hypothetical protein KGF54_002286 [Candida jiufengensis]
MSATPAKELGEQNLVDTNNNSTTTTTISQPKSFSDYTTPSPTDEESNKTIPLKKQSPSNPEFLTELKKFNVDQTKYKHYGHQSSMNSQSLNKIINHINSPNEEEEVEEKEEIENNSTITRNISPEKLEIENKLAQIFGIQSDLIKDKINWPYNSDTLNHLVKLQIEQEKTKQNQLKKDMGEILLKLITETKSSQINNDLLPFLFVSDSINSNDLFQRIERLKSYEPKELNNDIVERSKSLENNSTTTNDAHLSSNYSIGGIKRKYSDTQLPSFSETTQNIKTSSAIVSPLRSPVNRSPVQSHRRIISDSSDVSVKSLVSKVISPTNNPPQLPLPNSNLSRQPIQQQQPFLQQPIPQPQPQSQLQPPLQSQSQLQPPLQPQPHINSQNHSQSQSQQHSPTIPHQTIPYQTSPQSYPYYYPAQQQPQPIPQPPMSQLLPQPPPQQPIQTTSNIGSPYPPKFQIKATSSLPNVSAYPNYNQSVPPQYPYYPSRSPDNHQNYSAPPPQQQSTHIHSQQPPVHSSSKHQQIPVPTHQFETSPEHKSSTKLNNNDEHASSTTTPPTKRSKHSKNSHGGINFMITTPSNPPARKYNNPNREK